MKDIQRIFTNNQKDDAKLQKILDSHKDRLTEKLKLVTEEFQRQLITID